MDATATPQPPRVLFVRCGDPDPAITSVHGPYDAWFRQGFGPAVALRVLDPRVEPCDAAALDGCDAVVLSGSPHSVYEPLPWIAPLEALLRAAVHARRVPVLGVCFGHQLLAQALGGRVARNPRGRELGTVRVALSEHGARDPLFRGMPATFAVQATHADSVSAPPPGAAVLAFNDWDGCQAFSYGTAWGVQFHPELTGEIIRALVRSRADRVAEEGQDPAALLAAITETDAGVAILARFSALIAGRSGASPG